MPSPEIIATTIVRRKPGLVTSEFDSELVLLDLDGGSYYSFDGITTRIWELVEPAPTFGQLIDALLGEFEVPRDVCEKDTRELLARLVARGLVEV